MKSRSIQVTAPPSAVVRFLTAWKEKLVNSGLFDNIYASTLKNTRSLEISDLENIFKDRKVRIVWL